MMKPLRHAVIGAGAIIYDSHRNGLTLETSQVVAMVDIRPEPCNQRAAEFGCPVYSDYRQMLREVKPDVVVIITPHPLHPQMAIDSLEAGAHVLTEKPMAIAPAEADAVIAAVKRTGRLLAVNFQSRLRPDVIAAKKLIQEGRLGKIQRMQFFCPWPRGASYFKLSDWRATWKGEGGGVLLNQSPHDQDLICHLLGQPQRVFAWTRTRLHKIAVEDTAGGMMEWTNGAIGFFYASTCEGGDQRLLEVTGTGGILTLGMDKLTFRQFASDVHEYLVTSGELWRGPDLTTVEVPVGEGSGDHKAVYQNLHSAILNGTPLSCDAEGGRMSLELANAMILSSHKNQPVDLPLDRQEYANLLAKLQQYDGLA
jgi:predicted dehydrogenase